MAREMEIRSLNRCPHRRCVTSLLGGLSGLALGWSVWQPGGLSFGWLLMLSVFCIPTLSKTSRLAAFFGYYLAAMVLPITSLRDYDPTLSWTLLAGIGQLVLALVLAAPYALFAVGKPSQAWRSGAGAILALLVTALPPLGCVGLASPLFGATTWFGGLGTTGLILYLLLFGLCVVLLDRVSPPFTTEIHWFGMILALLMVLAMALGIPARRSASRGGLYCPVTASCPLRQITTVSFPFGHDVRTWPEFEKRARLITRLGEQILRRDPGTRLLVYPEEVAGPLDRGFTRLYAGFAERLRERHVTAALGALIPWRVPARTPRQKSHLYWSDGIVFMGQYNRVLIARQPAPVVEWNPLAQIFRHTHLAMPAFWDLPGGPNPGTHPPLDHASYGKTHVIALICYEQALVWPILWSRPRTHPMAILAPESVHWEKSAAIGDLEARLARAWGRLYGLPVALAINLPRASNS